MFYFIFIFWIVGIESILISIGSIFFNVFSFYGDGYDLVFVFLLFPLFFKLICVYFLQLAFHFLVVVVGVKFGLFMQVFLYWVSSFCGV